MTMSENPRIEELRRRVEKDPTSIAFAQLGEEYRRIGEYVQAVLVCRDGLARHPGYLSAQVTLGRALMELEKFDEARAELEAVLSVAPDNLAAIRALADIHQRRGDVGEAINLYAAASLGPKPPARASAKADGPARPVPPPAPPEPPPAPERDTVAVAPDMPPLEDVHTVDLSLDTTMPTSDEAAGIAVTGSPPADTSSELPALTADDLPSIEALDSLTFELPPLPDFSKWSLDTNLALDLRMPTFANALVEARAPGASVAGLREDEPALDELEQWLAAIVADRSPSQ